MAIKRYKPTTPGRRGMTVTDYSGLSKVAPEKSLLEPVKKHSGRNNTGRITVRHQGGGNRRKYRVIDFKREKLDMPATVLTLEYDPNRSAHIALVQYEDGEKRYILAPVGLKVGDTVVSGPAADIKPGNALPLANIPVGTVIHNVELYPGKGAQLARAAGNMAQLMAKEGKYGMVRLPSGELRNVQLNCMATIGQVGNIDHENVNIGKAGRILGMGDIVALVEKAQATLEAEQAERMMKRFQKGQFNMNDLKGQLEQMLRMGGMEGVMGMMPGMAKMKKQVEAAGLDDRIIRHQIALIQSMTKAERANPQILQASRKKRIAAGAGMDVAELNRLLKQHRQMADMMKKVGKMGKAGMLKSLRGLMGGKMPTEADMAAAQAKLGNMPGLGGLGGPGGGLPGGLPGLGGAQLPPGLSGFGKKK